MNLRVLLVALIALATAGFVIGTSIERADKHDTQAEAVAGEASHAETGEEGGEGQTAPTGEEGEAHSDESTSPTEAPSAGESSGEEFKPFGVDIEAVPFVILAALASLGLAFAAWLRPRSVALLVVVAAAMLVFAVLDVREVVHQSDEDNTGLAVLAAAIAALHAGAAGTAIAMARRAKGSDASGTAVTMPA